MTLDLDVRTLFAVLALVTATSAVLLAVLYRVNVTVPGAREWAVGMTALSVGLALLFLRGTISTVWSIAVGNLLIMAGHALMVAGSRLFRGRDPGWLVLGLLTVLFCLPTTVFHAAPDTLTLRLMAISGGIGVISLLGAHALARDGTFRLSGRAILAGAFFLHALVSLARVGLVAGNTSPAVTDLMSLSLSLGLYYLWGTLFALIFTVGAAVMVTERLRDTLKQRVDDLAAANARSRIALQEQRNFLTMVSHEFRTPLGIVSASADLIACNAAPDDTETADEVQRIRRATQRLGNLVDGVLADDWLESMSEQRRSEPLEVGAMLAGLAEEVEVRCETARSDPLFVDADPYLLPIAVSALLDNARKYGRTVAGVWISHRRDGDRVVIDVGDDGPGVPRTDEPRLFEKFYRAKTALHEPGGGLGLFLVRRIVTLHGGTVVIDQRAGTVFRITLALLNTEEAS